MVDEPAPQANASQDLSAEAASIESELAAGAAAEAGKGPMFNIYGFADFTWTKFIGLKESEANDWFKPWSSFSVGNLNVYLAGDLGQDWRSLAEIRFLYTPHGVTSLNAAGENERFDGTATDYADLERPIRWGGVEIERAWLEYTPHESLGLRVGQWLSPYGIWNVDHGSPVIISVHRPFVVGEGLIPERQTGLQLYGSFYADATQLGYHLTLSNGRGPIDAYRDLDANKAIGGRLFAKNDSLLGTLTVGVSGYRGKYTDLTGSYGAGPDGAFQYVQTVTNQYEELALAADLKWEYSNALIQGEAMMSDTAYTDDVRPPLPFSAQPGFTPDNRRWGFYGYGGYRTPWWNTMPFVGGEYYFIGNHSYVPSTTAFWAGLNVRPIPRVVLKAQYKHVTSGKLPDGPDPVKYNVVEAQAAWSF
jgi:hypothetical protein